MTETSFRPPSLFTFGCMSLGSDLKLLEEHVRIARTAMDADIWFHASPTYNRGFAYMVLRMAFDEARDRVPPMVIKIRCGSARLLRFEVEDALRRLGIETIAVAQLVFTEAGPDPLVGDFTHGGPIAETCAALREEGKVAQFCPQCSRGTSEALLPLAQRDAFDGFVLYLNPLQRDVSDELWNLCREKSTPLWALRTVGGALGVPERYEARKREKPDDPSLEAARRLMSVCEQCGCDWTTFCLRYARSEPDLVTTIGGTKNREHLQHFLRAAEEAEPLPADVLEAIEKARASALPTA